jgi:hypothetical protein
VAIPVHGHISYRDIEDYFFKNGLGYPVNRVSKFFLVSLPENHADDDTEHNKADPYICLRAFSFD